MRHFGRPVTLYSRDEALVNRLRPLLEAVADLRTVSDPADFRALMDQVGPSVVVLDVRLPEGGGDLADLAAELPHHALIALGTPRSDPMRAPALQLMFAAESVGIAPDALLRLIRQAQSYLDVAEECRILRQEKAAWSPPGRAVAEREEEDRTLSLKEFSRIIRCLDNVDALQERLLEELCTSMKLSRAGILLRDGPGQAYTVRAGWMLLDEARRCAFDGSDPFVRWLERHAHAVSRTGLPQIEPVRDQIMLRRVLDRLGAEILLPLRGRSGLLGWLFTGHPVTGAAIDGRLTDQLITVADVMAVSLESAYLYKEVRLQKTLAESLLEALPTGIVYADTDGTVRWFSTEASCILDLPAHQAVGRTVDVLGPRLATISREALLGRHDGEGVDWRDTPTGRPLRATAIRLVRDHACLGVLLMLQDRTEQLALKERKERLERQTFWTELAASMSHEVRNPLVAIKTFAQLLPERYNDPEFRDQFSQMVVHEVDRLNAMIDQINGFARPREVVLRELALLDPLRRAVDRVRDRLAAAGIDLEERHPEHLPPVMGDADALADALVHLLENAMEALADRSGGRIRLTTEPLPSEPGPGGVLLRIADNGGGMAEGIHAKALSPFCTTKARGMGLGLPLAHRTIADHNGRMDLATGPYGTTVSIRLPRAERGYSA